jgi:hypothetical protein
MGRSVTKDVANSWNWNFSGLNGNIPVLANPYVMLGRMKVFRVA